MQRHHPGLQETRTHRFVKVFRQRGQGHHIGTRVLFGGDNGFDRAFMPGRVAAVIARDIEHKHIEVKAAADHGLKTAGHGRHVTPDIGMVIERVGKVDAGAENVRDAL